MATCPVTDGILLRLHMSMGPTVRPERHGRRWKRFTRIHATLSVAENFSPFEVPHARLTKPSHVTDAWLAELGRRMKGRVATLDMEFSILHGNVAKFVPVS